MKFSRKHVLFAAIACAAIAAIFIARDWYYQRYVWPREIQQQLLGGLLAPSSSLIEHEGFSHYGQGQFRWRYRVEPKIELLATLCGSQSIDTCVFQRGRKVSADVTQSITYERGILTIEEDWS